MSPCIRMNANGQTASLAITGLNQPSYPAPQPVIITFSVKAETPISLAPTDYQFMLQSLATLYDASQVRTDAHIPNSIYGLGWQVQRSYYAPSAMSVKDLALYFSFSRAVGSVLISNLTVQVVGGTLVGPFRACTVLLAAINLSVRCVRILMLSCFFFYLCVLDSNHCFSDTCKNGASCTDKVGDFICTCGVDWDGKDCTVCKYLLIVSQWNRLFCPFVSWSCSFMWCLRSSWNQRYQPHRHSRQLGSYLHCCFQEDSAPKPMQRR